MPQGRVIDHRCWQNGGMPKTKHRRTPKAVLRLPDSEQSKSAVLNSLASVAQSGPGCRNSTGKGAKKFGVRIGNWLTAEQGRRLLGVFDRQTLRGARDYAMIAVLLGCGLRRAEVAALGVQDLQQREEHWVFADLVGKGCQYGPSQFPFWIASGTAHLDDGGENHRWADLSRDQQSGTDCCPWFQPQGYLGRRKAGVPGLQSRQRRPP